MALPQHWPLDRRLTALAAVRRPRSRSERRARPAPTSRSIWNLPPPPGKFGGVINLEADRSKPYWRPKVVPPRAHPSAPDHDGRSGLRRVGHSRRRHPHTSARSHREGGAALHAVPLHLALFTHVRGHHHRLQPPLRGLGVIRSISTGFPGYDSIIGPENATSARSSSRTATPRRVRQEPRYPELPPRCPAVRAVADGNGLRVFLGFMDGETDQWTPYLIQNYAPDLPVDRQARLQPHHRHGRRGHPVRDPAECRGARQADLRLLRARRHPRPAPAHQGVDRQVQGKVRHGLERPA